MEDIRRNRPKYSEGSSINHHNSLIKEKKHISLYTVMKQSI